MKWRALLFGLVVLAGATATGFWLTREREAPVAFQGYVEGNLVFMAAEEGGRIDELAVESGDVVGEGEFLFALDALVQIAQRLEAEARLRQAQAQLANLEAAQQRPEQIAVLRAQEERARAELELSQNEFERQQVLYQRGFSAKARLDQAEAALGRDKAALQEVLRQIAAAQLSGRSAEISAAEAAVRAAEATLRQAETRVAKRRVTAPAGGRIQDVYFRAGEVVISGQPVLALLPPANRRLRFYVPEPLLATLTLGDDVQVSCDLCPSPLAARISFISHEAEFTPPVIFSDEERAKLVFRLEARPLSDVELPLGLPVTVLPPAAPPPTAARSSSAEAPP